MSYAAQVLADSPTAYWQMNETSGTTITDSVASVVLTASTTPLIGQSSPIGTSISTNNGTGSYLATSPASLKWALDTDLCIEFLHQRGNLSATTTGIMGHRTDATTNRHFALFYINSNLVFDVKDSNSRWLTATSASDLYWHHYVFNHFGATGNRELWIDGVLRGTTTALKPTSADGTVGSMWIGSVGGQTTTAGSFDEVAIYNGASLSSARVQAHWQEVLKVNDATKPFLFASR